MVRGAGGHHQNPCSQPCRDARHRSVLDEAIGEDSEHRVLDEVDLVDTTESCDDASIGPREGNWISSILRRERAAARDDRRRGSRWFARSGWTDRSSAVTKSASLRRYRVEQRLEMLEHVVRRHAGEHRAARTNTQRDAECGLVGSVTGDITEDDAYRPVAELRARRGSRHRARATAAVLVSAHHLSAGFEMRGLGNSHELEASVLARNKPASASCRAASGRAAGWIA